MKNFFRICNNKYLNYTYLITVITTVIILIYSLNSYNFAEYVHLAGTLILLQFLSFFLGSFLGFLFGFPAHDNVQFQDKYQRNSSLKEITSWLTKIIVGIALIELKDIFYYSQKLVRNLSSYLMNDDSQIVIITSILGIFFILGFIVLYILSVTTIFEELVKNDKNIDFILSDQSLNPNEVNIDNALNTDFSEIDNTKKQEILDYVSKHGVNNLAPMSSKRLGKLLFAMKEYDKAAKAFKVTFEKDQEDKYSLLNYCFIRSKYLKDFDKSNIILKNFIDNNPDFAPAYYNLACSYNREYREFKDAPESAYINKLKEKAEENLMKAFEVDKGLYSEALKDSELKGLDVEKIFKDSKKEE